MIVEILEQLAVLLEPFVEPRAIFGREFVARDLELCNQVRTLDAAHAPKPTCEVRHFRSQVDSAGDRGRGQTSWRGRGRNPMRPQGVRR